MKSGAFSSAGFSRRKSELPPVFGPNKFTLGVFDPSGCRMMTRAKVGAGHWHDSNCLAIRDAPTPVVLLRFTFYLGARLAFRRSYQAHPGESRQN
jgi:hypothetical protein